jgi:hypothetical protein
MSSSPSCFVWNMHGLNGRECRNVVREFLAQQQGTVVCPKELHRGFDSLFLLVSRQLWKERNARTFKKMATSLAQVLEVIEQYVSMWCAARYKHLGTLDSRRRYAWDGRRPGRKVGFHVITSACEGYFPTNGLLCPSLMFVVCFANESYISEYFCQMKST